MAACGGSFWPDILIRQGESDFLVLELKQVKAKRSLTKALAEMIGQCLVYRSKYPQVIGFLVNHGLGDAESNQHTEHLLGLLSSHDIRIVIRQNQPL